MESQTERRVLQDLTNPRIVPTKHGKNEHQLGQWATRITSPEAIRKAVSSSCCQRGCIGNLPLRTIRSGREMYAAKNRRDQTRFIEDRIRCASKDLQFHIDGEPVCMKGFRECYGIRRTRFFDIKKKISQGQRISVDNSYPQRQTFTSVKVIVWMKDFFRKFGDSMPDSGEVHLPTCLTKTTVYSEYSKSTPGQILSQSQFNVVWRKEFSHVKVVKTQKFTVCTECKRFKTAMLQSNTREETDQLHLERSIHLNLQKLCRMKYYGHAKKAQDEPEKYVSIIIDNMDQQKTNLPHFSVKSKVDSSLHTCKLHVTGVLNHGQQKAYAFTWGDHFSGDSNIMLNCLNLALEDVAKSNGGAMPPVLYLQCDNCPKDNKNRYVISYLASLVKMKVFKKVKLSFLMVGHTHEDVDQMFSCISRRLDRQDATTIPELHHLIGSAYSPPPSTHHVVSQIDYKAQLGVGRLDGMKDPHVFKLVEEEGEIILYYKDWPLDSEPYRKTVMTHMARSQLDSTLLVKPTEEKVANVENNVPIGKFEQLGLLSKDESDMWRRYISTLMEAAMCPVQYDLPKFSIPKRKADGALQTVIAKTMKKLKEASVIKARK